jgi:hypothetical protein
MRDLWIYDYLYVIEYETNETYISPYTNLTDYYTVSLNSMPEFSAFTVDKTNTVTSSVDYTVNNCTPYISGGWNITPDCNPLYFRFLYVFDIDNDTITAAKDCGRPASITDYYEYSDTMLSDSSTLFERYDMANANNTITSYSATKLGILFKPEYNESIFTWHFDYDYPDSMAYIYPNFHYFIEQELTLPANQLIVYQFNTPAATTPIQLGILYNSTTGYSEIYTGNSGCLTPLTVLYKNVNITNASYVSLRFFFNKDTNAYSFRLWQSATGRTFYSEPIPFTWSAPFSTMQVYSQLASSACNPTSANYTLGALSMFTIDSVPAFSDLNTSDLYELNCTYSAGGDYVRYLFISDNIHGANYLNYQTGDTIVSAFGDSGYIPPGTDAVSQSISDLFGDSDYLKYLFALGVLTAITIGVLVVGASYGSAMSGVVLALFADTITVFLLVLIGVLPTWFAVVVFLLMALAIAYLISRFVGGGAGGDAGL